jgi:hypothetical protein
MVGPQPLPQFVSDYWVLLFSSFSGSRDNDFLDLASIGLFGLPPLTPVEVPDHQPYFNPRKRLLGVRLSWCDQGFYEQPIVT